jgi:GTPase SAR1 family protein
MNFKSKTHEAQLEDQKAKKSSRRSSKRRKYCKASKRREKRQTKQNGKEDLRKAQNEDSNSKLLLKQTPPNTLNANSPLR